MNKKWIELGLKYGGFMEQDRSFLENRLSTLTNDTEKSLLVTPPASVINAYFSELYQKRSPKDAMNYLFELTDALEMFQENPDFYLEGKSGSENFRFLRLNLSGKSFGLCFRNVQKEALVFSEFPVKITAQLLFEISQIFPDEVIFEEDEKIVLKPADFGGDFEHVQHLSDLTALSENENFMRLSGYNIDDLLEQAEQIHYFNPLLLQYGRQKFNVYIKKGF